MELSSAQRKNLGGLQTVQRVTAVLELCARQPDGVELGRCAADIGLPKSTVHRLFQQLCQQGYLTHPRGHGPYVIGPKFVQVASQVMGGLDVRSRARPALEALSGSLRANTFLAVPAQGQVVCVDSVERPGGLRFYVQVGRMLPVNASAPAKVLAAYLPEAGLVESADLARPATGRTLTSRAALEEELATVRRQGYGVCDEELESGVRALAAPIWGADGRVVAAMAVLGTTESLRQEAWPSVLDALRKATRAVTASLGGKPDPDLEVQGGAAT